MVCSFPASTLNLLVSVILGGLLLVGMEEGCFFLCWVHWCCVPWSLRCLLVPPLLSWFGFVEVVWLVRVRAMFSATCLTPRLVMCSPPLLREFSNGVKVGLWSTNSTVSRLSRKRLIVSILLFRCGLSSRCMMPDSRILVPPVWTRISFTMLL